MKGRDSSLRNKTKDNDETIRNNNKIFENVLEGRIDTRRDCKEVATRNEQNIEEDEEQ